MANKINELTKPKSPQKTLDGLNKEEQQTVFKYKGKFKKQHPGQAKTHGIGKRGQTHIQLGPEVAFVIFKDNKNKRYYAHAIDTNVFTNKTHSMVSREDWSRFSKPFDGDGDLKILDLFVKELLAFRESIKESVIVEDKLRQTIRDILVKELDYLDDTECEECGEDEELDESNVTGNVDGYQTPYAFAGRDKSKQKQNAEQLGYKLVSQDLEERDWDDIINARKEALVYRKKLGESVIKEGTDEIAKIYIGGDPYWLRKTGDSTHFHMANSEKGIKAGGWVSHVGEHRGEEYYNDVVKWLKGGKINGKKYKKFMRQQENINEGWINYSKEYPGSEIPVGAKVKVVYGKHKGKMGKVVDDAPAAGYAIVKVGGEKGYYNNSDLLVRENINEGRRGAYHNYRDDDSKTTRQKIGESLKDIREQLRSIEKNIDLNLRLKQETGIDSGAYWKRTHRALNKVNETMTRIMNKIRRF